uniref:ADP,ATP carrier protein n=1 Tax=Mesocestoides corti TaxID=53468 RepID=A0A5K3FBF2_MESCO
TPEAYKVYLQAFSHFKWSVELHLRFRPIKIKHAIFAGQYKILDDAASRKMGAGCTRGQCVRILTVIGSTLLQFSFGYTNTLGNLSTYLIRHLKLTASASVWFLGAAIVAKSVFTPIGEALSERVPYLYLLLATVVLY